MTLSNEIILNIEKNAEKMIKHCVLNDVSLFYHKNLLFYHIFQVYIYYNVYYLE